jgi:hypothetical protein
VPKVENMEINDKQKSLEKQIEEQRNSLYTDRLDLSFGEIMSMYERGEIIIKPAFQRYFRWDIEQRTRFIESLLLGIPIPPIFVAEDGDGVWELVDGLQRISTVLAFFGVLKSEDEGIKSKNNWSLIEGDKVSDLVGFSYETLPNKFKLTIKRAVCRVEILRWNSNYDMRFELFNRLNTGGAALTSQEIRNCIYRDISTKFNDFLEKLSKYQKFRDLIDLNEQQHERLYDQELVLRFLSLYKNAKNIKTGLAQHMSLFMENALKKGDFDYVDYEKVFLEIFTLLHPLGRDIFRNKQGRFTPTLFDVITIGIAENYAVYENKSMIDIREKINTIDTTKIQLTSSGDGQKGRIIRRLEAAQQIFG